MKHLLLFAMTLAAFSLTLTSSAWAKKSSKKSEPAPIVSPEDDTERLDEENYPGSFEETYEGNDRGGHPDEDFSDLFSAALKMTSSLKIVTEDRGATVVVTTTRPRNAFAGDQCALVNVQVIDKKSGEVLASDSINTCDQQL